MEQAEMADCIAAEIRRFVDGCVPLLHPRAIGIGIQREKDLSTTLVGVRYPGAKLVVAEIQSGKCASIGLIAKARVDCIGAGVERCAKKFGEEAVETALAAVGRDKAGLASEAADLLYHLLVLLEARGVALDDVMAELERRTAQTGLQEKASRPLREDG